MDFGEAFGGKKIADFAGRDDHLDEIEDPLIESQCTDFGLNQESIDGLR